MAEFLKRNVGTKAPGDQKPALEFCALMKQYPALVEFLTLDVWDAQNVRETGTVLACFNGDRWTMWLNDRDSGRSAWISGDTLTDLLDSAEDGLRSSSIEWRGASKKGKGGKGK